MQRHPKCYLCIAYGREVMTRRSGRSTHSWVSIHDTVWVLVRLALLLIVSIRTKKEQAKGNSYLKHVETFWEECRNLSDHPEMRSRKPKPSCNQTQHGMSKGASKAYVSRYTTRKAREHVGPLLDEVETLVTKDMPLLPAVTSERLWHSLQTETGRLHVFVGVPSGFHIYSNERRGQSFLTGGDHS